MHFRLLAEFGMGLDQVKIGPVGVFQSGIAAYQSEPITNTGACMGIVGEGEIAFVPHPKMTGVGEEMIREAAVRAAAARVEGHDRLPPRKDAGLGQWISGNTLKSAQEFREKFRVLFEGVQIGL